MLLRFSIACRRSIWFTIMSWGFGRDMIGFVSSYSNWTGGCGNPFPSGVIFNRSDSFCPFVLQFRKNICKSFLFISSILSVSTVLFNTGGAL